MTDYKYPLVANTIDTEEFKKLSEWIATCPRVTIGPLTEQFEEKWSRWLGRNYSIFCNSGSSANLLMVAALLESGRLENNKKVVVPSAAWITSIAPFIQLGFEPIMCNADPNNFGLEPEYLEHLLKEHSPSVVMMVHVLGVPCDMDRIMALKQKYGFILLEDACAAAGSSYKGRKVGTFGDMASISTYYGHQFSTIEGGLVSTDDKKLYNLLLQLRSHGWIRGLDEKSRKALLDKHEIEDIGTDFVFTSPGFNVRPTDLQGFIGLGQIDKMDWLIKRRFANHLLYKKIISKSLNVAMFDNTSTICSIHFCALAQTHKERNHIIKILEANSIETRPFTSGNQGLQPYWFTRYGKFNDTVASNLYHCGFFLPNHPSLSEDDIRHICSEVIYAAIRFRWEGA